MLTTIPGSTKISATTSHQEKCESSWEILLPAGWRRAVSSLKPVWALPDGQAVTASLPTWPRSQPSTAAAWALHTLAARALAVPAERACVCPHTQSQPKEHLGPVQNSHASVIFSHLRCKTELPCVKHVTSNPCWQIVSLQGEYLNGSGNVIVSHSFTLSAEDFGHQNKKNQTDISNNADVKQLGKKFKTT